MIPIIKRLELAEAALVKNGFVLVDDVWVSPLPDVVAKLAEGYNHGCGYYGQDTYIEAQDLLFRLFGYEFDESDLMMKLADKKGT